MKISEKPKDKIEAFQWPEPSHIIGVLEWCKEISDFESWVREFIPKERNRFKYRGSELVYDNGYFGETIIRPGDWVVLLEDEFGWIEPKFMTNEYVKEAYDIEDPE